MSVDWRSDVLRALPDRNVRFEVVTFESAMELINDAAYNRRLFTADFAGRAALAVAAYDLGLEWTDVTRKEHPIRDLRRHGAQPRRKYGQKHGNWRIGDMR